MPAHLIYTIFEFLGIVSMFIMLIYTSPSYSFFFPALKSRFYSRGVHVHCGETVRPLLPIYLYDFCAIYCIVLNTFHTILLERLSSIHYSSLLFFSCIIRNAPLESLQRPLLSLKSVADNSPERKKKCVKSPALLLKVVFGCSSQKFSLLTEFPFN